MSATNTRRSRAALFACGAGLLAALAVAPQADAATVYACVKKTSGATRIVTRTARCRHGEQRLSWSVTGSAGKPGAAGANGANGVNGVNGVNGAVAGFLASNTSSLAIAEKGSILVSKILPPGSYVVSGKTALQAHSLSKSAALAECGLSDTPGTTPVMFGAPIDSGVWGAILEEGLASGFNAYTTLPFAAGFTSTVTSTINIACAVGSTPVSALFSQLTAIQTSQNS